MSANSVHTKERLITAIANYYLTNGNVKLKVQSFCKMVGISRQAFHRYYVDLKPYVLGQIPVAELMQFCTEEEDQLFAKAQNKISTLSIELNALKESFEDEKAKIKSSYITSLMVADLITSDANQINERLEKQALHNDLLLKENKRLLIELTNLKSEKIIKKSNGESGVVVLDFPIDEIYKAYASDKNLDKLENEKEKATLSLIDKVNRLNKSKKASVIVFIDKFISSFKKFSESFNHYQYENVVIVRLPIFSRLELSLFVSKILNSEKKIAYYPKATSETTAKAQRQFLFRRLPESESIAADNMPTPLLQDGFDQVVVILVQQGD